MIDDLAKALECAQGLADDICRCGHPTTDHCDNGIGRCDPIEARCGCTEFRSAGIRCYLPELDDQLRLPFEE